MSRDISKITLRPGTLDDGPAVLRLADLAVQWLVANGRASQWGTEPMSTNPDRAQQVVEYAESGGLWLATVAATSDSATDSQTAEGADAAAAAAVNKPGERVVGVLSVGAAKPYVAPVAEPELYVTTLLTDRSWAGAGLGRLLLDKARELARQRDATLLRLECFAGLDGKLIKYYESQGFEKTEAFELEGWPGQVMAQRVDGQ